MEKAAALKRVDEQTNSRSEKFQKPARDGAAAVVRRSGGAVARRAYYLVFFFWGWKYGGGCRGKAPVRNIWSFGLFLRVARPAIRHERLPP